MVSILGTIGGICCSFCGDKSNSAVDLDEDPATQFVREFEVARRQSEFEENYRQQRQALEATRLQSSTPWSGGGLRSSMPMRGVDSQMMTVPKLVSWEVTDGFRTNSKKLAKECSSGPGIDPKDLKKALSEKHDGD